MRFKFLVVCAVALGIVVPAAASTSTTLGAATRIEAGHLPGGGDGGEKEKKEKGGKKEKDESTKDAKTSDVSAKPQQHARYSAKTAKQTSKYTQKEIMTRAKVRLFFHNMFNTKYGRPVNFRNTSARNRWSKGRRW